MNKLCDENLIINYIQNYNDNKYNESTHDTNKKTNKICAFNTDTINVFYLIR